MTLENLKAGATALGFIAIFAAAIAIALSSFRDTLSSGTAARNITDFGLAGVQNATSYMGTIGTLLGVGALIAVVVGAFYYMKS